MEFLALSPFIPSGPDFDSAKSFFQELGFTITNDGNDYVGFKGGACQFILQRYDSKEFAENLMLCVYVTNVEEFRQSALDKQLPEKFGVRISKVIRQHYGLEVNVIDKAGVCWHFIQQ